MSSSWFDHQFAALYARREEERLAEELAARLRERAASEPSPAAQDQEEPARAGS